MGTGIEARVGILTSSTPRQSPAAGPPSQVVLVPPCHLTTGGSVKYVSLGPARAFISQKYLRGASTLFLTSPHLQHFILKVPRRWGRATGAGLRWGWKLLVRALHKWRHVSDGRFTSGMEWHSNSAATCATELPYTGIRAAHPHSRDRPRKGGLNTAHSTSALNA